MAEQSITRGLIIGKFYPPHRGHQYLIDFARTFVDQLTVVVEKMPNETISVSLRRQWLQSIFNDVSFLILEDENPQSPEEHKDFWGIWERSLRRLHPQKIDYVFASETYGAPLAACLKAQFIPVDPERQRIPISGTQLRDNLYTHWQYLIAPAQNFYQKRICICGPESTGKTTLSQWLVAEINQKVGKAVCTYVPEYARTYLNYRKENLSADDIPNIARGQLKSENTSSDFPLAIVDTGVEASQVWAEFLFSDSNNRELISISKQSRYSLYLLCYPDVPWIKDNIRFLPDSSINFYNRLKSIIDNNKIIEINGGWEERNNKAVLACYNFIENNMS